MDSPRSFRGVCLITSCVQTDTTRKLDLGLEIFDEVFGSRKTILSPYISDD